MHIRRVYLDEFAYYYNLPIIIKERKNKLKIVTINSKEEEVKQKRDENKASHYILVYEEKKH